MEYTEIITILYVCGLALIGVVYINDVQRGNLNRVAKATLMNTVIALLLIFLGT